ncbi:LANO_0G07756g1_1 [Lachancea nothofagi CBS 11611]|uniref:Octanoyltransferase n=1 Tax=Lachancea nothofagi CBS 11611 TaxID=1266666 RepID=A0A1G4KHR5_9SACH|nr:LANO_0G07756g1_1 [Lachancea nothofagi CBS 11611]
MVTKSAKVHSGLLYFRRLSSSRLHVRFSSTCTGLPTTFPIEESSKVLKHLAFVKPLPFLKGSQIQESFVRAQLDMKNLKSKIDQKLREVYSANTGATINQHEEFILKNILDMKPHPIVLTFEFEPTYTGGKRSKKALSPEDISRFENFIPKTQVNNPPPKFVQAERGGQITFHGPGQVVAYLIMDLKSFNQFPAKCLVSAIEDSTISALKNVPQNSDGSTLELKACKAQETGVWIDDSLKIASIGVHVRRSITSHGVCINVCPDLSYLNNFVMCGLPDSRATSIQEQIPQASCTTRDVSITFVNELAKKLGIETVERVELEDIDIDE